MPENASNTPSPKTDRDKYYDQLLDAQAKNQTHRAKWLRHKLAQIDAKTIEEEVEATQIRSQNLQSTIKYNGGTFRIRTDGEMEKVYSNGKSHIIPEALKNKVLEDSKTLSRPLDLSLPIAQKNHQFDFSLAIDQLNREIQNTNNPQQKHALYKERNQLIDWKKKGWSAPEKYVRYFYTRHDPRVMERNTLNSTHRMESQVSKKDLSNNSRIYIFSSQYNNSFNNMEKALSLGIEADIYKNNGLSVFVSGELGMVFSKEIGWYKFKIAPDGSIHNVQLHNTYKKHTPYGAIGIGIQKKIGNVLWEAGYKYTPSIAMDSGLHTPEIHAPYIGLKYNW